MKKLTQAQIDAMAAKLNANGLGPGARVFDVETGEWTTAAQWRAKFDSDDADAGLRREVEHPERIPRDLQVVDEVPEQSQQGRLEGDDR